MQTTLWSEEFVVSGIQWFSQNVKQLKECVDVENLNEMKIHILTNEVTINLQVLHSFLLHEKSDSLQYVGQKYCHYRDCLAMKPEHVNLKEDLQAKSIQK